MNCPLRVKQIILTDNEFEASSGGINDEIIAATNVNSALFPKYYRRAVGFTGKLTARFVNKKLYFLKSIFCLQFMVNLVMILVRREMDIITTGVISLKIPILELGQMQIFAG